MKLSGKQNRYLRGLGHHLEPVVMLGKSGLTENIVTSTSEALDNHELIKIRVQEGCELDRREAAEMLAKVTHAHLVQVLGRTFLLYRRNDDPKIILP